MRSRSIACLILLLWVASSASASEYAESSKRVNLRTCPSVETCDVSMTLPRNTQMEVLERRGSWIHVRVLPHGRMGWVHSDYIVAVDKPPAESQTGQISPFPSQLVVSTHVWTMLALLVILIFSLLRRRIDGPVVRSPLSDLILNPRMVSSWIVMLIVGILGAYMVAAGTYEGKSTMPDMIYSAQFYGYFGWSLFWAFPACWRAWLKVAKHLFLWTPISCLGVIISALPAFLISLVYAYVGGGIVHFAKYWLRVRRRLHAGPAPAPSPAATV